MHRVWIIVLHELSTYLRNPMGYIIGAAVLLIDGLLFNAFALGAGARLSTEVLQQFFYFSSGTTMIAALLLSIRLFAEERQTGTMVLLRTAPISDWETVFSKFISAFLFLGGLTLLTIYMPLLIFVHGKVSIGHMAVGYIGLLALSSASLSIGLFASSLSRSQVVSGVVGAAILVVLLVCWLLAAVADPPLAGVFENLSLHNLHFRPFMEGVMHTRDLVYYASITYLFLILSVRVLAARRWS
ncbi:MAG: ABC transporter permease subunit [Deltaproteobacteria bacterium]|nr:ABC transporter permease subunit [Deltaproteobacteria bacterium]